MKNTVLTLVVLLSMAILVHSQVSYENRVEFELKDGYSSEKIHEFGESGFIVTSKKDKKINDDTEWKFEKYDVELQSVNTKTVLLNSKLFKDEVFTNKERIHSLYKDRKGNFSLVTIESANLEETIVKGILPKKAWVKDVSICGDYAFFNATIKRSPFLFSVNWKTGEKKLIPILIDNINSKKITLMNFQILESERDIFVYAKALINKRKSDIYVIRLNEEGEKENVFNLTENIDENIINISASKLEEDKYVFTGSYSTSSTYTSEGLFFCLEEGKKIEFIKFYNFLDLNNFLSYLPKKKQEKIEKKKKRKAKKGKELKISYRIAAHDLIQVEDGYLFWEKHIIQQQERRPILPHLL